MIGTGGSPSTTTRILQLLLLLLQRDGEGHPQPTTLGELRQRYQEQGATPLAATAQVERDLRAIELAGWVVRRQAEGSPGRRGRAPAELVRIWALLPGEDAP